MHNDDNLGFIRAQLTIARWYLDRAQTSDSVTASNHVRSARHAYDVVVTLLPKLDGPATREAFEKTQQELTALRARLRTVGEAL